MSINNMDITKALQYGWPAAYWSCGESYDSLLWQSDDIKKPSESEVISAWNDYLINKALYQYRENRKLAYPSIKDQLDMQYWDNINGTTTWIDALKEVKEQHPKPEGLN